jgi:hypothetical protein
MLEKEALWIGQKLAQLPSESIAPVLNVGSATAAFREDSQPYIDRLIFAPLRQRNIKVEYTDLQSGPGVDLSGDLNDPDFFKQLIGRGYRSVLCCNLLEHVSDPRAICAKLEGLMPADGIIVVTVPHRFPYHPDPIDTMFRPTPAEIASLFPLCTVVHADVIDCGTGWEYVGGDISGLIKKVKQRLAGRHEHGGVKGSSSFAPWLFRQFKQSCVILRKSSAS